MQVLRGKHAQHLLSPCTACLLPYEHRLCARIAPTPGVLRYLAVRVKHIDPLDQGMARDQGLAPDQGVYLAPPNKGLRV